MTNDQILNESLKKDRILEKKLKTKLSERNTPFKDYYFKINFLASVVSAMGDGDFAGIGADSIVSQLLNTTEDDWKKAEDIVNKSDDIVLPSLFLIPINKMTLGSYLLQLELMFSCKIKDVRSHKRSIYSVANAIESFPTYLSKQSGPDSTKVRLYDPLTGSSLGLSGQEQENKLMELCNAVRPLTTKKQLENKIMPLLGADARLNNRIAKSYSGTRYLLVNGSNNGIVDITTFPEIKFYSLRNHQRLAQKIHFPNSSIHNLDWPVKKPPLLKNELKYGKNSKDWNPQNFLDFIGNSTNPDSKDVEFSTVLLGLGFFCNHNSAFSVDIAAPSGTGKSSIIRDIYTTCYDPDEILLKSITDFDQKTFPLNNLNNSTQIMMLDEIDSSHHTLTDSLSRFDNLNDNNITVQVKNQNDRIIENPPEVYGLGIKVLSSNHATDGLLRRLAILSFSWNKKWKQLAYARNLDEDLTNRKVVSYIFYRFLVCIRSLFIRVYLDHEYGRKLLKDCQASDKDKLKAWLTDVTHHGYYHSQQQSLQKLTKADQHLVNQTVHHFLVNKLGNFHLNLNDEYTQKLLPKQEKELRTNILGTNYGLDKWFLDYIEPYLSKASRDGNINTNDPKQLKKLTILHPLFMFRLYSYGFYQEIHPGDNFYNRMPYEKFQRELSSVFEQYHYSTKPAGHAEKGRARARRQISYMQDINFDFRHYQQDYKGEYPRDYAASGDDSLGIPFRIRTSSWFYIYKNTNN